jgi:RND family efflux transporter MFP subunit
MKAFRTLWKIMTWVIGLALLAAIVLYLAGVFHAKVEPGVAAPPPSEIPTFTGQATVQRLMQPLVERVPGTLSATRDATVSARIMALIAEIQVRAGDRVERGQTLVRLDSRDLQAREEQASQTVSAARARLTDAEKEFNRFKKLLADGIIPQSQFDTANANYQAAQAEVARAEQALNEARTGKSFATITAPFGGRVIDRYAEPGDTAIPGQALLKLYDPTHLRLEADVPESLAATLKPGTSLHISIESVPEAIEGRIEEIVPMAEPGSRSVLVKVALPSREDLFPGMFGRLLVPAGQTERIYAPAQAVHHVGQLAYVWVKEGKGSPERRFVKLGENTWEGQVEILSGLQEGTIVLF